MYHALLEMERVEIVYWWYKSDYIQSHQIKINSLIPVFFDNLSAGTYQ
jgi:hypothetical protein